MLLAALARSGYRARLESGHGGRWAVHGVRRGWSRFAGLISHLALVAIVLGVAIGAAFGSETVFTLLPGDQALLDTPEPGFSAAVRLDAFDAEFGPDARPRRIDTHVTFLREGAPVREAVLRVNEPGDFDGYLVHPWTYGPAARIRITTLDGSALLDAPVPLEGVRDGLPVGSTELPSVGMVVGLALTDPGHERARGQRPGWLRARRRRAAAARGDGPTRRPRGELRALRRVGHPALSQRPGHGAPLRRSGAAGDHAGDRVLAPAPARVDPARCRPAERGSCSAASASTARPMRSRA